MGPQISQSDYYDIQALLSAGDIKRQEEQNLLNEMMNYYYGAQQWPYQMMQSYSTFAAPSIGGGYGSTTSPNPYYISPASQMMGGLATAGGLGLGLYGLLSGLGASNPITATAMAPMVGAFGL